MNLFRVPALASYVLLLATSHGQHISSHSQSKNLFDSREYVLTTKNGKKYRIDESRLVPLTRLFSPQAYRIETDTISTKREERPIAIFRMKYDDGSTLQVYKQYGAIQFLELHQTGGSITYVVNKEFKQALASNAERRVVVKEDLTVFDHDDMLGEYNLTLDEVEVPVDRYPINFQHNLRSQNHGHRVLTRTIPSRNLLQTGDKSSSDCTTFQQVNVAIAYDEEFCEIYGNKENAELQIQAIVAGASLHYEHDSCIQLVLHKVIAPGTCNPRRTNLLKGQTVNKDNACGTIGGDGKKGTNFLYAFTKYSRKERVKQNIADEVPIHLFSGHNHKGAQLGCTYGKRFCDPKWEYGLAYMKFAAYNPAPQIVVFAHELAHTLGAQHYWKDSPTSFIMTPHLTSGEGGFSKKTVKSVSNLMEKVQCHTNVPAKREITATILFPGYTNLLYFFYNEANVALYSKYNYVQDGVIEGYPKPVMRYWGDNWPNSDYWPTSTIVHGERVYFLFFMNGKTKFFEYNTEANLAESEPIDLNWNGLPNKINYRGTVVLPSDGMLYLFDEDKYYRYNIKRKRMFPGYPRKIQGNWNNWPKDFVVTAGFVSGNQRKVYFFGGFKTDNYQQDPMYIRYDVYWDSIDEGYPKSVRSRYKGSLE